MSNTDHHAVCRCYYCSEKRKASAIQAAKGMLSNGCDFSLMVRLYNLGYHAGHEHTVEACFAPIHHTDMDAYHADVVEEILQETETSPSVGATDMAACSDSAEWWVIDRRPNCDLKKRGPFKHSETAAAVRSEMETNDIYDSANLCVVSLPSRQN